ncbi:trichohyalin [Drosophila grimshawi]|uniref:GH20943 n=1 Tax=Drosophila grimshawi TaxID=7222 RepID=B4J487_DROGR|nr:trichohyalin [Drosophila grimshawi]EDW00567.1 GH20943 [Drosophila grimshawi]
MTPKRKRRSKSRAAAAEQQQKQQQQHQQLLAELELTDSCCDICHCDCYSSHSSGNASGREELHQLELEIRQLEQLQRSESAQKQPRSLSRQRSASKSPTAEAKAARKETRRGSSARRSKSAGSQRSQSRQQEPQEELQLQLPLQPQPTTKTTTATTTQIKQRGKRPTGALRDCQMLQTVFGLDASATLAIRGSRAKSRSQENMALVPLAQSEAQSQLCASMANLCLVPTVRAAYEKVPQHDQKILNRMAVKRSQQAADKEHAWLARKYWENERLEQQLLKCEQLEEYKQAVHDKQFQDYLLTKARLQALAERDLAELRRLRGALDAKDAAAKQRLQAMRLERDLVLCQRRYEESRRSEAVTLQQEEQQLDATLRKRDTCMRLTERLRRADELRNELLEGYLRRLQHDNQVEQLQHEEHWRERQQLERLKREQLQHDIQRKRQQSQRFVDTRQRRHEARFRTAKISASLRELVRQSVTPESALDTQQPANSSYYAQQQSQLSRLLFNQK